jgi:hypothetical protein
MSRAFGLVLVLIALYIGMTIYTEGIQGAFGGALAPIRPTEREAPLATHLTPGTQLAEPPMERSRRVWVTDVVREQVQSDLKDGARRRGY